MAVNFQHLSFSVASESEFNDLAAGIRVGSPYPWPTHGNFPRIATGEVGVLWRELQSHTDRIRPFVIVVNDNDQRRLFSRFSQLRSDLSPLSSWCHIMSPEQFQRVSDVTIDPYLNYFDAAWAGLAIAEAAILADRPISQLKLVPCLATQSFAIGRTTALWSSLAINEILQKYDEVQKNVRSVEPQIARVREAFIPIWTALYSASGAPFSGTRSDKSIADAFEAIRRSRATKQDELFHLREALSEIPEAAVLDRLDSLSAERRLKEFDVLIRLLNDSRNDLTRRPQLAFLAGYIATVAAGGAASLSIAEAVSREWPDVTGFAYALGGVGELVTWTSGFDGLGRLVARELDRPFTMTDAPTCDICSDEASVLVDKQLSDPLVHLRLKQLRVASVALYPGVNLQVPFTDYVDARKTGTPASREERPGRPANSDPLAVIADALMPYLVDRLRGTLVGEEELDPRSKPRWNRKAGQRKLPLDK